MMHSYPIQVMRAAPFLIVFLLLSRPVTAQQSPPAWSLQPELRIGSVDDGPTALGRILHITINPQTGAIALSQLSEIRLFDSRGNFIQTVGREAGGPGEFSVLAWIGWIGRELVAVDPNLSRVTRFSEDGRLLGTIQFDQDGIPNVGRGRLSAALAGGFFVSLHSSTAGYDPNERYFAPLIRSDEPGSHNVLDQINRTDLMASVAGPNGAFWVYNPVPEHSLHTVDPNGSSIVVAHQRNPANEREATFRVRRLDAAGNVIFSRTYQFEPVPVPPAYVHDVVSRRVSTIRQRVGVSASQLERAIREMIPAVQPPISAVVAGVDGSTWLRREELVDSGRAADVTWWVLDARGDLVGQLRLPAELNIRFVDSASVWAEATGELDVPLASKYRIVR